MTRLRNRITGQVPTDIRLLMMSLFQSYRKISANNPKDTFDNVATISYDIDEIICIIYDTVDNLRDIVVLYNRTYTNQKMVDLGYIVVSKLLIFQLDIRRWLRRNPTDQSWQDFQDVFTTSHQELRETEASLDDMGYQSENAMVIQMVNQVIAELRSEIPEREHTFVTLRHENPPPSVPLALAVDSPAPDPNAMSMFDTVQANMDAMRLQMEAENQQPYVDYSSRGRGREYGEHGRSFSRGFGSGRRRGVERPLQYPKEGRY